MLKRIIILLIVSLAGFAGRLPANGVVIPDPPRRHPPHRRRITSIRTVNFKQVRLDVTIRDQVAETTVEEIFENPNNTPLEGTFLLPIPEDAQVSAFSFFINGQEVKGEILSKEKASKYYQEIVAKMIDPAILEYMDKGLVRVKMFPIPPRGQAKIRFGFHQVLPVEGSQIRYYYPFGTNKFSAKPLDQAVVDIKVHSTKPLKAIYTPNYKVDIARKSDKEARITYEKKHFLPKEDLTVYIGRSDQDFGITVAPYRVGTEDGYFLLVVSPAQKFGHDRVVPKDIVFIMDTSGSMAGKKLDQAKEALSYCVRSLSPKDRFNLVVFSTTGRAFKPGLMAPTEERVSEALSFIDDLAAVGGTNIEEALQMALKQKPQNDDRPFMVVFLTDGQPTVGVTDKDKLLAQVAQQKMPSLRLFAFGVGDDVNTHLLDRLAGDNRGTRHYVRPGENLEVRVSSFYQQIAKPVLSDVKVTFSKGGVYDMFPTGMTDIFSGQQVILMGRYSKTGGQAFKIEGRCGDQEYVYCFPVDLPEKSRTAAAIPRLWATRKIGYLLDSIRLNGANKELVGEIKTLAKRFGIVTPYTSSFVHEEGALALGRTRGGAGGAPPADGFGVDPGSNSASGQLGTGSRRGRSAGAYAPQSSARPESGKAAVDMSEAFRRLKDADKSGEAQDAAPDADGEAGGAAARVRNIGAKTFYLTDGAWTDSRYKKGMTEKKVAYLSQAYFDLLNAHPALGQYLSLGSKVTVCVDDVAYVIAPEED